MLACKASLLALLSTAAVFASAQTRVPPLLGGNLPAPWKIRCEEALKTPLPPEARTEPRPLNAKPTAFSLYYGVNGVPQDFERARVLAWQERVAAPLHPGGYSFFSGALILAMIYANGDGVAPNPALALRMGCEATAYPNDLPGADLDTLNKSLTSSAKPAPRFDICGPGSPEEKHDFFCGYLYSAQNRKRLFEEISGLTSDWTPEQRAGFEALHKAESRYAGSSSIWEEAALRTDQNPQANDFVMSPINSYILAFDNSYLEQWKDLANRQPVSGVGKDYDAELSQSHLELMDRLRAPGRAQPSNVVLNVLQERGVERDWTSYRDAWVAVVTARSGAQAAAAWRERMTEERTERVKKLIAAYGPPDPAAAKRLAICAKAREVKLPAENSLESAKPADFCRSYQAYYGIGEPRNFVMARRCAIAERDAVDYYGSVTVNLPAQKSEEDVTVGEAINGSLVLMALYANGEGVVRQPQLATRFACESIDNGLISEVGSGSEGSSTSKDEAKYEDLLNEIASPQPPHLNPCDWVPDISRMQSECDLIATVKSDQEREAGLQTVRSKFTPEQKAAFDKLLAAQRAYFKGHDHNEVEVMGHFLDSGGWDGIHREREDMFLVALSEFEGSKLPQATEAQYAESDRALNSAYAQVIAKAAQSEGTITGEHLIGDPPTRASIRTTERLWLAYRDAFADFGALRYAGTTRAAWLRLVTLQRTKDLLDPCFMNAMC
jgi:uncharacterized protein YecT (DUF1311 family)